ncbi:MAG: sugar ABC transporter ATP-binding protein [Candidatus Bathyanammoxibius sp.]
MPQANKLLLLKGINKQYPGVRALVDVDFEVALGEVHALVGVNGAGKSTLIKILSGATRMDKGEIFLGGRKLHITSPHKAIDLGISVIYQEFNLVPELSVAENVFLGREPHSAMGFVDYKKIYREVDSLLDTLGAVVKARTRVAELGVAQQQLVEIARALAVKAKIIAMDEPTAALSLQEADRLFAIVRRMKDEGKGIIFISHRMEEIFQISDRVTVLRDGRLVATKKIAEINRDELVEMILGKSLKKYHSVREAAATSEVEAPALEVEGLTRHGVLDDVHFSVKAGEILGIAGLVGAGKTELARAVVGLDRIDAGRVLVRGRPRRFRSPIEAIKAGVVLVPEDRKNLGLVLGLSVRDNISLPNLLKFSRGGFINKRRELRAVGDMITALTIKTPSEKQLVRNLSGGNQQKVVLAKWLLRGEKVFIFDEPTRGIDVGAKVEIYQLINNLVKEGTAIVVISSEFEEILELSDRIMVMHAGRVEGELNKAEATADKILFLAMGGKGGANAGGRGGPKSGGRGRPKSGGRHKKVGMKR